ncbi:AsmA family protein [Thiothrix nivea]|uniref:AsmA family protein n=1 Tax=Thiothrix nivea (strain ATCC 35100 / DSM 5205 / JP2) TaxID=870187 RepID=A0A656HH29_THINJ|nr:AsmA family protein [Thiothrix nivea]EIJ35512.1 AsmA family protein [Thiothrix nivea DSM 5205]
MAVLRPLAWLFALVLLVVAAIAMFALTFDANRYKPELVTLVKEKTGRDLNIDGDIELSFYPNIALQLGQVKLGNAKGFDSGLFAEADNARVAVQFLPLLEQQLKINEVYLQGLKLNLHRNKSGKTNWEDLLPAGSAPADDEAGEAMTKLLGGFVVAGVSVEDSQVRWRDDVQGKTLTLAPLNLKTSAIHPGEPVDIHLDTNLKQNQPALDMHLDIATTAQLADNKDDFTLTALKVQAQLPDQLDASVSGNLQGKLDSQQLAVPDLQAVLKLAGLGTLNLGGNLKADLSKQTLDLGGLQARAQLDNAVAGKVDAGLSGDAHYNLDKQVLSMGGMQLQANLQGGELPVQSVSAKLSGQPTFKVKDQQLDIDELQLTADVEADQIPGGQLQQQASGNLKLNLASGKGVLDLPKTWLQTKDYQLDGQLQVQDPLLPERKVDGSFKSAVLSYPPFELQQATLGVHLGNGQLQLTPTGTLFKGNYQGTINIDTLQTPATLRTEHKVQKLRTEDLLFALTDDRLVTGALDMNAKLDSVVGDAATFKQNLNGVIDFELTDGTIRDANFAQKTKEIVKLFEKESINDMGEKEVAFTTLKGQWKVKQGVFSTAENVMTAPHFQVKGNGEVNIVNESLDFKLRVGEKPKPDKPEGLFAPLHIFGPWSKPSYEVELDVLLKEMAKHKLDEEKGKLKDKFEAEKQKQTDALQQKRDEAKDRLKQELQGEQDKLEQRLQDQLQKQLGGSGEQPQEGEASPEDQLKKKLEDGLKDKLKGLF